MRRFFGAIVAAVVLGLAVWLGRPGSASTSSPETIEPPSPATKRSGSPADADAAARAKEYLGVSSCAASACHGGPISKTANDKWRSSYTVWATLDKHSRAYSVLFDERSKRIIELLNASRTGEPIYKAAEKEERCLACHAAGQGSHPVSREILADGVACELCHGPAQNWLKKHTERAWLDSRATEFKPLPEMTDTRDLHQRATTCASCHVGSREPGQPVRDVNHDLIAAGHPRLNFEFHAYLGVMPKHWTDEPGVKPNYTTDRETHAKAWAIGQATSGQAAFILKAARAAAAKATDGESAPTSMTAVHGAEFSEFDCYACHHALGDKYPSVRQEFASRSHSPEPPGVLPANPWYSASSPLLYGSPPVGGVWDAAAVDRTLALAADAATIGRNWDCAAQRFLALEALLAARRDLRSQPDKAASSDEQELHRAMEEIRKLLEFPTGCDSPRNYDPTAVQQAFERLSVVLRQTLPATEGK